MCDVLFYRGGEGRGGGRGGVINNLFNQGNFKGGHFHHFHVISDEN